MKERIGVRKGDSDESGFRRLGRVGLTLPGCFWIWSHSARIESASSSSCYLCVCCSWPAAAFSFLLRWRCMATAPNDGAGLGFVSHGRRRNTPGARNPDRPGYAFWYFEGSAIQPLLQVVCCIATSTIVATFSEKEKSSQFATGCAPPIDQ